MNSYGVEHMAQDDRLDELTQLVTARQDVIDVVNV
jgi:hypothetical protein